jgi:hypothetical protein
MIRTLALSATIAVAMTTAALAADRATFVLIDGSRQSGEVVFHGSGNRNIIDNFLNLGDDGHERTFPVDQVVMIDFAGDQPTAADFQQMPAETGHLVVLRNGNSQRGKLLNMVNGNSVQWQTESGQTQDYAMRDVSRIYLNPSASRRLYPQFASITPAPATGVVAATKPVPQGAIRVSANQPWAQTGVRVSKGERVVFSATGQVQFSPDPAHIAGPDGNTAVQVPNLPVRAMSVGGLIARIDNGTPFPVGSNRQPITMGEAGLLLLGVNDTEVGDNSGSFVVQITPAGR